MSTARASVRPSATQLLQKYESRKFEIISAPVLKGGPVRRQTTRWKSIQRHPAQIREIADRWLKEGSRVMGTSCTYIASKKARSYDFPTHPGLVKRLFRMHTPELEDGTVEIKAISREAGSRTKWRSGRRTRT
jgi:N utilization substance protein A